MKVTMVTRRVMVGTQPKNLVGENLSRVYLLVSNQGVQTIYLLGSKADKKEDGIPIKKGEEKSFTICKPAFYAVSHSGTVDVRVMAMSEEIVKPIEEMARRVMELPIVAEPTPPEGGGGGLPPPREKL